MPKGYEAAKSFLSGHDALYIDRAKRAMPILVRLARAERIITYGDLAEFMDMPNPRNLNYVLGSVGVTIKELSVQMDENIPPLQSLVVNAKTGSPGEGFDGFLKEWFDLKEVTPKLRLGLLPKIQKEVFSYDKWDEVLQQAGLTADGENTVIDETPPDPNQVLGYGGGESKAHKDFKCYLADNPQIFGLPPRDTRVETEHTLRSGDAVDVLFSASKCRLAVEAKSSQSTEDDMVRGLFQSVKYKAVMRAEALCFANAEPSSVLLALEGEATDAVRRIAALLDGVEVIENARQLS